MRSRDREAVAVVCKRVDCARDDGVRVHVLRAEDAELVAAHPVRRAAAGHEAGELLAEPGEQHVAGGMAEEIVVLLEAVQVEQRRGHAAPCPRAVAVRSSSSFRRFARPVSASVRASSREPASISHVLPERHREACENRQDGRRRKDEGQRIDLPEVVVHEHGEREETAADRGDEHRPALEAGTDRPLGRLPRSPGEQHAAARPSPGRSRHRRRRSRRPSGTGTDSR